MRFTRIFASVFLPCIFLSIASAEIKIKVVDPREAAVASARVQLLEPGKPAPTAVQNTSAEGVAIFREPPGSYRIEVLAPGFAPATVDVSSKVETTTIKLRLATAAETVVVTATRTPVPSQAAGANVDTLRSGELEVMQPVAADDAVRFLPGAVVNSYGQRGALSSLFVRGGESTYNKVIVDGVYISEAGQTFDFGTLPLTQADRLEFARGAQSTLYGSDAMTSVVQVWTRTGSTEVPELRFGADGGNFGTANGYASVAGARDRFDYNLFGDQFNTNGQGVNNSYSDSLQGANVGAAVSDDVSLRMRVRHSNSYVGLPGAWSFNGDPLVPPLSVGDAHNNSLLGSVEADVTAPSGWQHRFTASDYYYRYTDNSPEGNIYNFASLYDYDINHVALEYQGDYSERTWAHTTFGYRIENENAFFEYPAYPPPTHGQRLNQDGYLQQQLTLGRLSVIAGGRFVHSSAFGNTGVPRVALTLLALRGSDFFSGTRLRFSYATGYMEPDFTETFVGLPYYVPNPGLLPERTRAFEVGFQQSLIAGRWALNATYFNNLFHDQIEYGTNTVTYMNNPPGTLGQFFNVQESFAQGAEVNLQGRLRSRLSINAAYTYTSTEYLQSPYCADDACGTPLYETGNPLLRRPKHSGTMLLTYLGTRWGANLAGSFVGRRPDSDFVDNLVDHAAGYARVDLGGWYAITSRITAYVNVANALNDHYNEVVGYPALTANFRAGMRFRVGGD
ncbi:MAG TPA: TonB-dependent receptor [Terriglobales bacterium]|jgi:vitamin B12 transporter|nr:TonB-dependent receptor [Terriglobales bacterium]